MDLFEGLFEGLRAPISMQDYPKKAFGNLGGLFEGMRVPLKIPVVQERTLNSF